MTTWMYLTDMAPKATIVNLETNELRSIMSSAVTNRAPIGLRRFLLTEQDGGQLTETGAQVHLDNPVLDDLIEFYDAPNSWNYDWPHPQVERMADADPAMEEKVRSKLMAMMGQHPYEFEINALQRRFLMYYSDGNYKSQKRFDRLIPSPRQYPYRSSGQLQRRYSVVYNNNMRDANVPIPNDAQVFYGELRPCLYVGPAWVVRFRLDGQEVLSDRCRVYVDDDANFICSDWCQRHDFSSYGNGINLQTGIYTFDTWVTGPCLIKNLDSGSFKPKNVTVKRTTVRELMHRTPQPVPTFDTAFTKAAAAVAKYSPKPIPAEVGPITADVMAEAIAQAEAIVAAATKVADPAPAPAPATEGDPKRGVFNGKMLSGYHYVPLRETWEKIDGPPPPDADGHGYVISYAAAGLTKDGAARIRATKWYTGDDYMTARVDADAESESDEYFVVDADSPTGFWYVNADDSADEDPDSLNKHWWLYSAAVYYSENLIMPSAVQAVLLEA